MTGDLKPGQNVLAVEGRNIDGPFGLVFGLAITLDDGAVRQRAVGRFLADDSRTDCRMGAGDAGRSLMGKGPRDLRGWRGALGWRCRRWNRPTSTAPSIVSSSHDRRRRAVCLESSRGKIMAGLRLQQVFPPGHRRRKVQFHRFAVGEGLHRPRLGTLRQTTWRSVGKIHSRQLYR